MSWNEQREFRRMVVEQGFQLSTNQAGPLLEQMLKKNDTMKLYHLDGDFFVEWNGFKKFCPNHSGSSY